jgi:hypothetical protein
MRQLVKELNGRYQTAPHNQKMMVAEEVVFSIKRLGGRFLKKQAEKYWVEVCHSVAVEKICQSFRAMQRRGKNDTPRILQALALRHLAAATEQQPNNFLANAFNTLPLLQYPSNNNLAAQNASRAQSYYLHLALQERADGLLVVPHEQASRNHGAPSIPMAMMATSTFADWELSKEIDSLLHQKRVDEEILARLTQYSAPRPPSTCIHHAGDVRALPDTVWYGC